MNIQKISLSHLKEVSKLKLKKYREETNSFLIESEKILIEALKSDWHLMEVYLTRDNFRLINQLKEFKSFENCKIFELSEKEFKKISNEITPSGIGAKVEKKKFDLNSILKRKNKLIPVFERISDPGNLGTIIRSADWFGFDAIVLSKNSVEITNPKVIKASMGSIFHLQLFEEVDLPIFINQMKKNNYKILGTTTKGKDVSKFTFKENCLLIFGNESMGISKEISNLCDELITIPAFGSAESLNLASSASIFFYELRKNI